MQRISVSAIDRTGATRGHVLSRTSLLRSGLGSGRPRVGEQLPKSNLYLERGTWYASVQAADRRGEWGKEEGSDMEHGPPVRSERSGGGRRGREGAARPRDAVPSHHF